MQDPDFIVESLHETEGHFMIRPAVADNPVPMAFDHSYKVNEWFEPAPAQLALPVVEKFVIP